MLSQARLRQLLVKMMRLELGQHLLSAVEHVGGNAGEAGNVNAIALVRAAGRDLVQKDDVLLPFADELVAVALIRQRLR